MKESEKKHLESKNSEGKTEQQVSEQIYEAMNSLIYTLIHELKTPLREISLYAEFIEEDNAGKLQKQSLEDIRSIQKTCGNMMDMIQRLMEYSKAGFKNMEYQTVNMEYLVRQCLEELLRTVPERKIELEITSLPEITADRFLIRLIVMNLLSNSVKFSREKQNAKIRVCSRTENGSLIFYFRDNGIGFDMTYADHIFEEFGRLQNEGSYEGNGIGLATVKKIVERYEGTVRISGWPGKGCEVQIAFPEKMRAKLEKSEEENAIKIGIMGDFSGIASKEELGKHYSYQLAAEEINRQGGIDGRPVKLLFFDDQSNAGLTKTGAEYLTEEEQVDVLMGSTLSPSRDIMRRQAGKTKTLFLDTQQTEGGVASHYTFCLSALPEQQMSEMLRFLLQKYGPKCYIAAADYNYGILSAEWAKYFVRLYGGEVVGIEYLDRKITDFHPIIDRIVRLNTDVLISLCVFPNHDAFYQQWHERKMNHIPNATTQVAAEFFQNVEMEPPILENTYVMASFIEELHTSEAKKFVEKYRKHFGKEKVAYMNMDSETAYVSMYLYKMAVEYAGTTETEAVIRALESGKISYDGPGGKVTVRGEDHHTVRTLSCFRLNEKHQAEELFRTKPIHSDYIEMMIEENIGVKGGIKALGINADDIQYNMLLDKIR